MYSINDLYNFLDDIVMGKDDYKENREKIREITHNPTEGYSQRIIEHFNL